MEHLIINQFEKNFKINNCYFGEIKISKLLKFDIEIPGIQRIKDDEKINDIMEYQLQYFKKHDSFNFLSTINIHYVEESKQLYLIDGQHRFEAIKEMYNKWGQDINIVIEFINIVTMEELKENYKLINKNTPLPEFSEDIDKEIPEKVAIYFKNKYSNMWSKNSRARRPHLYFNFFQEALGFLTDKLKITTSIQLQEIIESHNSKLCNWSITNFPENKTINESMINKCKETGFFLGMFKHTSDEYGYKWVKALLHLETGEVLKPDKKNTKKIPKKIKDDSWNKYVGKEKGNTYCICCDIEEINSKNFIGGHIISRKNGGHDTVDNIIPICSSCNLSMSSTNMDEFIKEYYPDNIDNFKKKKYNNHQETSTNNWSFGFI